VAQSHKRKETIVKQLSYLWGWMSMPRVSLWQFVSRALLAVTTRISMGGMGPEGINAYYTTKYYPLLSLVNSSQSGSPSSAYSKGGVFGPTFETLGRGIGRYPQGLLSLAISRRASITCSALHHCRKSR
jgi:hypothetical protein